jgi:hypothetical protein
MGAFMGQHGAADTQVHVDHRPPNTDGHQCTWGKGGPCLGDNGSLEHSEGLGLELNASKLNPTSINDASTNLSNKCEMRREYPVS